MNMPLSWPPRIQVAGVSSLEEALVCRSVGIDALGFTLEVPGGVHDGLTRARARDIIDRLPADIWAVVITYLDTAEEACRLVKEVQGAVVQFHGGIAEAELLAFREECPGVKTIRRVTVASQDAVREAVQFRPPLWDAIILDSLDPRTGRKGATGRTHDWSISSAIVKVSPLPVILAGGLTPENVAQAIRIAAPSGVDAHTGVENGDGTRNFEKIRAFAKAALQAFRT
jgi:phosphoribosylanthranilate isomerase